MQATRRNRTVVQQHTPPAGGADTPVEHDRGKDLPLPVGEPDPFLERTGIATPEVQVRARMRRELGQTNASCRPVLETKALAKRDQVASTHRRPRAGIPRQLQGNLLTDALRAQILRILGYRHAAVECISTEHTAKNLMIRTARSGSPGSTSAAKKCRAIVERWRIVPHLS